MEENLRDQNAAHWRYHQDGNRFRLEPPHRRDDRYAEFDEFGWGHNGMSPRRRRMQILKLPRLEEPLRPFPVDSFMKLERNDIWAKVLKNFTEPSDISSAYLSCNAFRNYLEDGRNQIRLSKVFGILKRKGFLRNKKRTRYNGNPVLNLRLVSKSWKQAIEDQFFKHPFSRQNWYLDLFKARGEHTKYAFSSTDDVDIAMDALSGRPAGASLCKIVVEVRYENEGDQILFPEVARFLHLHGDAVVELEFRAWHKDCNNNLYDYLHDHVSSMPNLNSLDLVVYDSEPAGFFEKVKERRFPCIASLKRFKFYFRTDGNKHLVTEILTRNPGIKSLQFGVCNGISRGLSRALGALKLERLKVDFGDSPFELFMTIGQFDWPLKVFRLEGSIVRRPVISSNDLIDVLNKFRATLVKLDIEWNVISSDGEDIVIDFPNLKLCNVRGYDSDLCFSNRLEFERDEDDDGSTDAVSSDSDDEENGESGDESNGPGENEDNVAVVAVNHDHEQFVDVDEIFIENDRHDDHDERGEQAVGYLMIIITIIAIIYNYYREK